MQSEHEAVRKYLSESVRIYRERVEEKTKGTKEMSENNESLFMYVIMDTTNKKSVAGPAVFAAKDREDALIKAGVLLAEFQPDESLRRDREVVVRPF